MTWCSWGCDAQKPWPPPANICNASCCTDIIFSPLLFSSFFSSLKGLLFLPQNVPVQPIHTPAECIEVLCVKSRSNESSFAIGVIWFLLCPWPMHSSLGLSPALIPPINRLVEALPWLIWLLDQRQKVVLLPRHIYQVLSRPLVGTAAINFLI